MTLTTTHRAGLYCRLSKDDEQRGESTSIGTQRSMMTDYCSGPVEIANWLFLPGSNNMDTVSR